MTTTILCSGGKQLSKKKPKPVSVHTILVVEKGRKEP